MTITTAAEARLKKLFNKASRTASGLRFEGYVGTCRGSTPVLKPVEQPLGTDERLDAGEFTLYIPSKYCAFLNDATLDYDSSFMGRGLILTWPHSDQCPCQSEK